MFRGFPPQALSGVVALLHAMVMDDFSPRTVQLLHGEYSRTYLLTG